MANLHHLSDAELLDRLPALLLVEHRAVADVVEHLAEIDRRRLYLEQAYPSLHAFCRERYGYSEDEASKRIRVARLALEFPQVLDELRTGALQLSAAVMLAPHVNQDNAAALLTEARRKSRNELTQLLVRWFPRPDVPPRLELLGPDTGGKMGATPPGAGLSGRSAPGIRLGADHAPAQSKLEPLSAERYLVQFTASAELHAKLTRVRELLSHSVPNGDLALLVDRALDALIEREVKAAHRSGQAAQTSRAETGLPAHPPGRGTAGAGAGRRPVHVHECREEALPGAPVFDDRAPHPFRLRRPADGRESCDFLQGS